MVIHFGEPFQTRKSKFEKTYKYTALSLITCYQFNELEEIFLEDEVFAYI